MSRQLNKLRTLHSKLEAQFHRSQSLLDQEDDALFHLAPDVSGWSVARQLHHTALATGEMLAAVDRIANKQTPAKDGGAVTTTGKLILRAGRFPRGKGKAPERTVPAESISREDIRTALNRSKRRWETTRDSLQAASESSWTMPHPYFGDFGAQEWLRLASIHADHHFRIIDDILKTR